MKKKYEKPQVYIERFELAQHIAKCDWDFNQSTDPRSCEAVSNLYGWSDALFSGNVEDCTININPDDYERYCVFAGKTELGATWNS